MNPTTQAALAQPQQVTAHGNYQKFSAKRKVMAEQRRGQGNKS